MNHLSKRAAITSISAISAATAGATLYYTRSTPTQPKENMLPSYEATFSVPLECDTCVTDIKNTLSKLPSITATSFSIPSRLVTIKSTSPPSTLISTIQSTGRDAILRGSGKPNSAAVCILEIPPSFTPNLSTTSSSQRKSKYDSPVRGLARLIQLSEQLTLLDLTLTSLPQGRYNVSVRKTGDISRGAASLGPVYTGDDGNNTREGELGVVDVDKEGRGNLVGEVGWKVWELVGRGMCVESVDEREEGRQEVVGVVARSAGVWENEKVVCGCSGKTVWEEREEMVGKGIL